ARTADLLLEQAARGERAVANQLRGKPEPRSPRQQSIARIPRENVRRNPGGLTVGRRRHQTAEQRLEVPAALAEVDGAGGEQLAMAGPFALRAEVVRGLDDAGPENHLPEAVDLDARGERMGRID